MCLGATTKSTARLLHCEQTRRAGPFGNGQIRTIPCRLFAGIDVNAVPATSAPGTQQQMRFCRAAERRRPRGAFVAFSPHRAPISHLGPRVCAQRMPMQDKVNTLA